MRTTAVAAIIGVMALPAIARAGERHEILKLKGDFRHRHELIQLEDREDQNRWRIRARLAVEAEISESWSAAIGLASGPDDPVSANQALTDGFSTKDFGLDLAYFDFHPKGIGGFHVVGGKMKLPFETAEGTELVWDGDLRPEGIALRFGRSCGNSRTLVATKEIDGETVDVYGYAVDFDEVEVLGLLDVALSGRTALALYGNYVNNVAAEGLDTGWLVGGAASYGRDKGAVKVYANYRRLEADAVVGAFTDSDFIGGGTNGEGFELGAMYGVAGNASLDLTYFVNTKGIADEEG